MRTIARVLGRAVTAVITIAVLGLVALLVVLPRVSASQPLTVLSSSMEPTIPVGTTVFIRPVDATKIAVGDVITYQVAPGVRELITHRVLKVRDTSPVSFVTQGDNNGGPDLEAVPAGAVRGEVWFHVPYLGYLSERLQGSTLIALVIIGLGLVLLGQILTSIRGKSSVSTEAQIEEPVFSAVPGSR